MVKSKRVYEKKIDHSHDISYENELAVSIDTSNNVNELEVSIDTSDNVNSPSHYKHGKKETIDVIRDCMESDEYHGYLKGNVLKYVSRYKFKGEPLQDLEKAQWYLNRLIKEVKDGGS